MTAVAGELAADAQDTPVEAAEEAQLCANCGTARVGPFCHACGQKGHLHSRLWHMLEEVAQTLAQFDGRFWRTLPLLVFNPGRLSCEWREGRRARYMTPLTVFLFGVFLLFVIPELTGHRLVNLGSLPGMSAEDRAAMNFEIGQANDPESQRASTWFKENIEGKLREPDYLSYRMENTAKNLAFLLVPESILILALLLAFKRGYTWYDHAVVSLYGLGFMAIVVAILTPLGPWLPDWSVSVAFLVLAAHAIAHLKGAYRLSWWGAALRGVPLLVMSMVGFVFFVTGVVALGLFGN